MDKDKVIHLINDLEAAVEKLTYLKAGYGIASWDELADASKKFENAEIALLHELGFSD